MDLIDSIQEDSWQFLKVNTEFSHDLEIPLLDRYSREMKAYTYVKVHSSSIFKIIAEEWKQFKCPLMDELIKCVYSHNDSLFSHRRSEMLILRQHRWTLETQRWEKSDRKGRTAWVIYLRNARIRQVRRPESRVVVVGGWGRGIQEDC